MGLPPLMVGRKIVATEAKSEEEGEIEEVKKETLNGKNVLFKSEGFPKLSKEERK